ncbi:MAG: hemerythrin domain-containing protein [Armatimonadia bacterium]
MKATETLRHEHDIILLVLDAAENEATRQGACDRQRVSQMVDFFRGFVDKCHHAKEEGYLFPTLVERGLPLEEGPIAVMLDEHEEGRGHVRAIAAALEQAEEDNEDAIAEHLAAFVDLLRAHIGKENNVLFPLADQLLGESDQQFLTAEFERVEREEIGEGVHERYHELAHELAGARAH